MIVTEPCLSYLASLLACSVCLSVCLPLSCFHSEESEAYALVSLLGYSSSQSQPTIIIVVTIIEIGSLLATLDGLELEALLLVPPKYWDYSYALQLLNKPSSYILKSFLLNCRMFWR